MKRLTPIDWQSFSLKKDIEIIVQKLQKNRDIQASLLCELALVVLGVALSNIFAEISEQRYFWVILFGLSGLPLFYLAIKWLNGKIQKNKFGSDKMEPRSFINAFDNEIAYYILMSESYFTMLVDALANNDTNADKVSNDLIHFYYIQASYYFVKTIADLAPLNNIADEVMSLDVDTIATERLIALPRYNNVKNMLIAIYEYLEKKENIMDDLDNGKIIVDLNKEFKRNLERIDKAVNIEKK